MEPKFKVTRDCLFKYIFGNPKNIGILISLINLVLRDSGYPKIKQAHKEYEKFLSDEHLQHLYIAREMYQHDEASRIAEAEDRGKKSILLHMKKKGHSIKEISELTGLSEDEINSLLK